jgi:hypothetical protein
MPVRCLSFHAAYRCRETGACCTAGWPIPIEADRLTSAEHAMAEGRLRTAVATPVAFLRPTGTASRVIDTSGMHEAGPRPAMLASAHGACVFHRAGQSECCNLQRALGPAALPLACRQFPRVSVVDPRGVSITLSHYCPTAAALLDAAQPPAIVVNGPAFPADGEYVGLDARTSLPPLLRPGMLMNWEAWWAWEARSVALIGTAPTTEGALDRLALAVERTRTWTPGDGPLVDRVTAVFNGLGSAPRALSPGRNARVQMERQRELEVLDAVPDDLRPPRSILAEPPPRLTARRNFLLAHAFANWAGYLGQGLRTWLRSLEAVEALLAGGAGVRTADLLLRHLADPFVLADRWSEAERG